MDGVVREQDGDPEPRFVDGDVLELVDPLRVDQAEDGADPVARIRVLHLAVGEQLDLLELLLGGHLGEQVVDARLDGLCRRLAGRGERLLVVRAARCDHHASGDRKRERQHRRGGGSPVSDP